MKKYLWMLSAAVMIGTLRITSCFNKLGGDFCGSLAQIGKISLKTSSADLTNSSPEHVWQAPVMIFHIYDGLYEVWVPFITI